MKLDEIANLQGVQLHPAELSVEAQLELKRIRAACTVTCQAYITQDKELFVLLPTGMVTIEGLHELPRLWKIDCGNLVGLTFTGAPHDLTTIHEVLMRSEGMHLALLNFPRTPKNLLNVARVPGVTSFEYSPPGTGRLYTYEFEDEPPQARMLSLQHELIDQGIEWD